VKVWKECEISIVKCRLLITHMAAGRWQEFPYKVTYCIRIEC